MIDINLLKQIFGDNVTTISSPEEVEEKMKVMADFFKKVQPKEEEEEKHDCSKCNIPQNLCFAKPEVRSQFRDFAAGKAASSITRIVGGKDPVSTQFSMATVLKYTDKNPEVSGLKPTISAVLNEIKDGNDKIAAEVLLDLILLYMWCNK